VYGFPKRDDGWHDVHREYGAEAVRRKVLHDRYVHAIRMAYHYWLTLNVCLGMGGMVSQDNFDQVNTAIDWAATCREEWLNAHS
jgi:hypothetical protein